MTQTTKSVYKKCLAIDADIYHFHDPELLRIGLRLKKQGKIVIYDAHEDLPRQILSKHWIPTLIRRPTSYLMEKYENYITKRLSAIITATPYIRDRFQKINRNTVDINNFPILKEFNQDVLWKSRKDEICYLGGIAEVRGIKPLVESLSTLEYPLNLAGPFMHKALEDEIKSHKNWPKINYHGNVNRQKVAEILYQSKVGIVTLLPIINYLDSLPIKMFEYMAAGLPVVASDFPLWRQIIDEHECGILVDPTSPEEITDSVNYLLKNPEEANLMGERGKSAALSIYNWSIEESKLVKLYNTL